jgi:hypothetical protein
MAKNIRDSFTIILTNNSSKSNLVFVSKRQPTSRGAKVDIKQKAIDIVNANYDKTVAEASREFASPKLKANLPIYREAADEVITQIANATVSELTALGASEGSLKWLVGQRVSRKIATAKEII